MLHVSDFILNVLDLTCFYTIPFILGKRCEAVINMCHFNLCQNNAVCQRFQNGGYKCICHAGFTGECCESFENIKCNSKLHHHYFCNSNECARGAGSYLGSRPGCHHPPPPTPGMCDTQNPKPPGPEFNAIVVSLCPWARHWLYKFSSYVSPGLSIKNKSC